MEHLKEFLVKTADDELIIGHRNSEWTGLGPILEEDIAFSSMAQDKIGHALALYSILHEAFDYPHPDQYAFSRKPEEFRCCHFVEMPNDEYDFSLVRHFLFDHAEFLRYSLLADSSFDKLSQLARKIKGELKYHVLHADSWIKKLGQASEESNARMQKAIDRAYPMALGLFEKGAHEKKLIKAGIFQGEDVLQKQWTECITTMLHTANLKLPTKVDSKAYLGGRTGKHTAHLAPMLKEMTEVFQSDPLAEW